MFLRCINKIVIQQVPDSKNTTWPNRNKTFTFNKIHSFEVETSWSCLTDTAKVKFPKYFSVKDQSGLTVNFGSAPGGDINNQSITANFGNMAPLFLRGDKITIYSGYAYFDASGAAKYILNPLFDGYVTAINNKTPIELECQNAMYIFKQVQAPNKNWGTNTMEEIITSLVNLANSIKGTNFKFTPFASTNVGTFITHNETACQILERLQRDYKIESFFRNDFSSGVNVPTLYSGLITYYPGFAQTFNFVFQKNIVSDSLNYTRLDDVKIGIHAYSVNKAELLTKTKSGRFKTKNKRLQVQVGTAKENDGQVRTMYFWNISSEAELTKKATQALQRFYYEGYRGKFLTFALPFVRQGDIVSMDDRFIPERMGDYFAKKVTYKGGEEGNWQEIDIDLRVDGVFTTEQLSAGI